MTALIAQLVAVACAELGLPPALAQIVMNGAVQLVALIPEAKLERLAVTLAKEAAHWLATRPAGPEPTPDYGGNTAATFGTGPPVVVPPEPDEGATLGGNVPATFGSAPPAEPRPEPEGTRGPGDPGT